MNRRDFLKTSAIAAILSAVKIKTGSLLNAAEINEKTPDVVAVRNGDVITMFQKGIAAMGTMAAFVKPGQKVVVKPNIAWDCTPERGANTSPKLVAEIVRQALSAGASEVTVFDHTCNTQKIAYKNSGIESAAVAAGAKVLPADKIEYYTERNCPEAIKMKKAMLHNAILSADVFINVPILKHHGGAKMTAAMKNLMGIVFDRQFMHKNNLEQCIADSVLYRKPDLNIVDAYRVMKTNGPKGVTLNDVEIKKYMLLSKDIVAIDAMAAKILGFDDKNIPYIRLGERHGLGTSDIKKLSIKRIDA